MPNCATEIQVFWYNQCSEMNGFTACFKRNFNSSLLVQSNATVSYHGSSYQIDGGCGCLLGQPDNHCDDINGVSLFYILEMLVRFALNFYVVQFNSREIIKAIQWRALEINAATMCLVTMTVCSCMRCIIMVAYLINVPFLFSNAILEVMHVPTAILFSAIFVSIGFFTIALLNIASDTVINAPKRVVKLMKILKVTLIMCSLGFITTRYLLPDILILVFLITTIQIVLTAFAIFLSSHYIILLIENTGIKEGTKENPLAAMASALVKLRRQIIILGPSTIVAFGIMMNYQKKVFTAANYNLLSFYIYELSKLLAFSFLAIFYIFLSNYLHVPLRRKWQVAKKITLKIQPDVSMFQSSTKSSVDTLST